MDKIIPFEKSFASSDKAQYWSTKNIIKPENVTLSSGKKFWFDCINCHHTFDGQPNCIKKGVWCSYCSSSPKKLCDNDDCKLCFVKSFASSDKSQYWSIKNQLKPRQIFKSTGIKYLFDCIICNHSFNVSPLHITQENNWCPYCVNQKLCDDECKLCFNKSFASSNKAQYWSDKNKLKPRQVFKKSDSKKFIFNGICGHEFNGTLGHITNGGWCPYCVNKTEQKLYEEIVMFYPLITQQYKVEWCRNKNYLPYDFALVTDRIIIELDGRQHFEQVSNWTSPEDTHENDIYKMKCAKKNGFSVIRLIQQDVWNNSYEWLTELIKNIEKIKSEKKIQIIYMCKNNEYNIFNKSAF